MARDRASRPEAKAARLFVAVEVPAQVRAQLNEAFAPWRTDFPRARWVPHENLHVTIKFLGATWPRLREWVDECVAEVASSSIPFRVWLAGVGAFPSPSRARVVWAGLADEPAGALGRLAGALDASLSKEFTTEKRAFHPHLTVARSDPPLRLPTSFADTAIDATSWSVDRIAVMQSHLRRPAPLYEPTAFHSLSG
jgi:RNA 2',3'-cyclic 3'-phosphodiesterase